MEWLKMKRIVSTCPESILSTFVGETAGDNADNILFPILNSCQEDNPDRISLSIIRIKLKCCQDNKWVYYWCPTITTIPTKPIQSTSVPIKTHDDSDHHQVVTWTLKWTRRIQTTSKLITTKLLKLPIQDQPRQLLI